MTITCPFAKFMTIKVMIKGLMEMSKQGVSHLRKANCALNGHAIVKDQLTVPS